MGIFLTLAMLIEWGARASAGGESLPHPILLFAGMGVYGVLCASRLRLLLCSGLDLLRTDAEKPGCCEKSLVGKLMANG
jgi:hypothetical protein